MEKLSEQQALNILVNAARIAQQKGAFTLEEAEIISNAIRTFSVQPQTEQGPIASNDNRS